MLKKNLFKNVTSAVLAMFFLFSSVTLVSFATLSKGKKSRNSNLTARDIMEAYDFAIGNGIDIDDCEYDHSNYYVGDNTSVTESNTYCRDDFEYDYSGNDGKVSSPKEDHEDQNWKNSVLSRLKNSVVNTTGNLNDNGETEGNNISDDYDREKEEEKEWNERTPNGYMRVGDYLSTTEEETNNLNDNDDHIANAEGNGTQNVNTETNNNNQNNPARSQNAAHRDYQESWNEIVFSDDNNE